MIVSLSGGVPNRRNEDGMVFAKIRGNLKTLEVLP